MNLARKQIDTSSESFSIGMVFCAYFFWGFLVLYIWFLDSVSPLEIAVHRALWSMVFLWIFSILSSNFFKVIAIFKSLKIFVYFAISSILLSLNWVLFVYAISVGNTLATSMAYFICPTITMVLALSVFKERLNHWQWLSMFFIFLAIMIKIYVAGEFPLLSLSIALSWSLYALMQKKIPFPTANRLTIETTLALPILVGVFLVWKNQTNYQMQFLNQSTSMNLLLIGCGLITTIPLLLYNFGVKKSPMKWVSVLQYIIPSTSFFVAIFIFGENLDYATFVAFCLIWVAMIFFILAQLQENRKNNLN